MKDLNTHARINSGMKKRAWVWLATLHTLRKNWGTIAVLFFLDVALLAGLLLFSRLLVLFAPSLNPTELFSSVGAARFYALLLLTLMLLLSFLIYSFLKYVILSFIQSLFEKKKFDLGRFWSFYGLNLSLFFTFFVLLKLLDSFASSAKHPYNLLISAILFLPFLAYSYTTLSLGQSWFFEHNKSVRKTLSVALLAGIKKVRVYYLLIGEIAVFSLLLLLFYPVGWVIQATFSINQGIYASLYSGFETVLIAVIVILLYCFLLFNKAYYYHLIIKKVV